MATLIVAIVLFYASIFSTAAYRCWKASRLLDLLRELHPGQTTEAQARLVLKPLSNYEVRYPENGKVSALASDYSFYNLTAWQGALLSILPEGWGEHLFPLAWTRFGATIHYRDGVVSELRIIEGQQEHLGDVHPIAASVDIYSTRFTDKHDLDRLDGFAVHHQNTQAYDDHGNTVGSPCCDEEFTTLDERASAQQRSQALNFRPSCLMLPCKAVRKLRPPF